MISQRVHTYEARLYLGSRERYHGRTFREEELVEVIGRYQKGHEHSMPLRVTPTNFVHEEYSEAGWEVAAINYPRWPKSTEAIHAFMEGLAEYLIDVLKQNRISVVYPDTTIMYQGPGAEEKF